MFDEDCRLRVGDTVMLTVGSPHMTVTHIDEQRKVTCVNSQQETQVFDECYRVPTASVPTLAHVFGRMFSGPGPKDLS